MLDSLYGNLLYGPAAGPDLPGASAADAASGGGASGAKTKTQVEDDMFAELARVALDEAQGGDRGGGGNAAGPVVLGPVAGPAMQGPQPQPQPQPANKDTGSRLPQAFSAAKLMMPPVRKRAEPVNSKRVMPALDLNALQAEKEALLRQRASAEKRDDGGKTAPSPASSATASAAPSPATSPGPVSSVTSASATEAAGGAGFTTAATGSTASAASPAAAAAAAAASASALTASSLYGSPDEEYDPAKPNDYDEFCRRRMRQKAEEEMARRREEALARQQQAAKPQVPEPKEDDFATRMMKKMGWKEGQGMGKDGQGISTPLVMKKTDIATGVIAEGQKRDAAQPAQGQPPIKQTKEAPKKEVMRPPAKVLLLNNMVGRGEVDEDLEEETAEEAGKYGKLTKCVVKEIPGVPDDEAVRIFLQYEKVEDATKALLDMNGRYFGGRVVRARFFDEKRFECSDLDKRDDD